MGLKNLYNDLKHKCETSELQIGEQIKLLLTSTTTKRHRNQNSDGRQLVLRDQLLKLKSAIQ